MIKGFNKFFESKSIHFEESKEFYSVRDRHRLSDSTIKDYFTDLIDDGFDISISVDMRDQSKIEDTMINENGIRLSYSVNLLKRIENPNKLGRSNTNLKKYSDFLELQSNYIKAFDVCCERICQSEELFINTKDIILIPFWGSGNSTKELDDFNLSVRFYSYITTNELIDARKEFQTNDNPLKQSYKKIIEMLKKRGVSEAERLVDTQDVEEHGFIMFGFLTNDEIIILADFHYDEEPGKNGLIIHQGEVDRAINEYNSGNCSDYLE
jgi:hypothetical protein